MPSFSREPNIPNDAGLPEKFKNLLDVVEHQQQFESTIQQLEAELVTFAHTIAPVIFLQLRRMIDRDLLFTTETDLVMPEIKRATAKMLDEFSPENPRINQSSWTVDVISREVRIYILGKRMVGSEE